MEKFGSMVHYVINEPLKEFNLRMQVRNFVSHLCPRLPRCHRVVDVEGQIVLRQTGWIG